MNKKLFLAFIAALLSTAVSVKCQTDDHGVVNLILSSYSTRAFSNDPVADHDLNQILECGVKAPSARNKQPWRFTVVKDFALMQNVVRNVNEGNVLIVVSGLDAEREGINVDFDCALATENMYIAAQGLGLGAHIYTGPVKNVNATMKEMLAIPEGYRVVSVLRIGNPDRSIDAVSAASPRNPLKDIVNYK